MRTERPAAGGWLLAIALSALSILVAGATFAVTCSVPSTSYPTIQAAADTPTCSSIVAAAGTYPESLVLARTLTLQGAGPAATFVLGSLRVRGAATIVQLAGFQLDGSASGVSGCWSNLLDVDGGAQALVDSNVEVAASQTATPCRLLRDGFESGTLWVWTAQRP